MGPDQLPLRKKKKEKKLKKFREECLKCGSTDDVDMCYIEQDEELQCHCERCGAQWNMETYEESLKRKMLAVV